MLADVLTSLHRRLCRPCSYIVQRTTWDDVDENFRAAVLFEQAQASARAFLLRVESLPPLWTRGTHNLGGEPRARA